MKLLTPEQYAKKHKINRATVYRRIKAGRIPVVYETKEFMRIPADAIEKLTVKSSCLRHSSRAL
jgi:predicted site-specific integrase-resolvase